MSLKKMTESFVLTYDFEQVLAENEQLKKRMAELGRPTPLADPEEAWDDIKLAEMIMSDCGISCDFEPLKQRIAKRIAKHVAAKTKALTPSTEPSSNP